MQRSSFFAGGVGHFNPRLPQKDLTQEKAHPTIRYPAVTPHLEAVCLLGGSLASLPNGVFFFASVLWAGGRSVVPDSGRPAEGRQPASGTQVEDCRREELKRTNMP